MEKFEQVERIEEAAAIGAPATPEGWVWDAEMLKPGVSLNGFKYSPEFIRESAPLFEGAPAFADHQDTANGSVRNLIGYWRGVKGEGSLTGQLHLLESETWMRDKMLAAQKAGSPLGVSISIIAGGKKATHENRSVFEVHKILPNTPRSADVVMFPSAGGRVLRAVAGEDFESALRTAREAYQQDSATKVKEETGSADGAHKGAKETMDEKEKVAPAQGAGDAIKEELKPIQEQVDKLKTDLETSQKAQRVAESHNLLEKKIKESKLPEPAAKLIREEFTGREIDEAYLDKRIVSVREAFAAMAPSPARIGGPAAVVMESQDKMEIALQKLCGIREEWEQVQESGLKTWKKGKSYDAAIPSFQGIQEAYIAFTGDRDLTFGSSDGRVKEDWQSSGFTNALGNTLHRRLIADYMEVDYGLDQLVPNREPHRVALKDFRTHEIARVGYLADLNVVDPEVEDWPEITTPTDEKATIAAVQFGGILSVTRKTIINDDIGVTVKAASRLGRSAKRTLAQRVISLMTANAAIYDAVTFFHSSSHGANLGTTALASAELNVVRTAMRAQTEKDSSKKLGIGPYLLMVPIDLEGLAKAENMREFLDSNLTPNKVRFMFGQNGERIIVQPLLTDTNDWYVFANPDEIQTFEIGFLQGRQEPELLVADVANAGKAFSSDRVQYKVRHEYEATVVDYRGAYRESVA